MLYLASFKYQKGVACFPEKKKDRGLFLSGRIQDEPFRKCLIL